MSLSLKIIRRSTYLLLCLAMSGCFNAEMKWEGPFGSQQSNVSQTPEPLSSNNLPSDHLELWYGDGQTAQVGTQVTTPPTIRVVDKYGNPVANVALSFSPMYGGTVGSAVVYSDQYGFASTSFTVGTWAYYSYSLYVSAFTSPLEGISGPTSLTFYEYTAPGPAFNLSLQGSPTYINTNQCTYFYITVYDQYDNYTTVSSATTLNLTIGGVAGSFHADYDYSCMYAAVSTTTINSGYGYGPFNFKASLSGNATVSVSDGAGIITGASLSVYVNASSGSLDPIFGGGSGKVVHDPLALRENANAVAIDSLGRIVVAGYVVSGINEDFLVTRYNPDGSVDTTFGGGTGVVTIDFFGQDRALAVAIDLSGNIVVAGAKNFELTNEAIALASLYPNGTVYWTLVNDVSTGKDRANAVAIDSSGRILVAGYAYNAITHLDFALLRYNNDGGLDASFNGTGIVTTALSTGSFWDVATAIAIQPDGKIVLGGYAVTANQDFALARYNQDGSLDTSFGTGGKVITPLLAEDNINAIAIDTVGSIYAAGVTGVSQDFVLAKYTSSGYLDISFGFGFGYVTTDISGTFTNDVAYAIAIDSSGKILVGGTTASNENFALVRYDSYSGSLDYMFGSSGIVLTNIGGDVYTSDTAKAIAIQQTGSGSKIVLVGTTYVVFGSEDIAIAQYVP